ncbi:MAG: hypothetical protein AAF593_15765 [Planctomycetota bacterium]
MSMHPPPLPPDPYAVYPEVQPGEGRAGLQAAIAVWVTSGLFFLLSTCCVFGIVMLGVLPMDQLQQADETGQLADMWDEISQVRPYMPVVGAVLALFTVLPAAVMFVLGFWVKGGSRGATITALIISIIGLVAVGLMLLLTVVGMVTSGQIDLCSVTLFLGLAGCFVWCVLSLKQALSQTSPRGDVFQPMHQHPAPGPGSQTPGGQSAGGYRRSPDDDPWENSL